MTKKKIAVLGGGCGSVAAAFILSDPKFKDVYDVTLYTANHRLGGKGASGRNAEMGQRIEEHGLHMWMGFYVSAFETMKDCFDEWKKPEGMTKPFPFALFERMPAITMEMYLPEKGGPIPHPGEWFADTIHGRGNDREPWVPDPFGLTLGDLLRLLAEWLKHVASKIESDVARQHLITSIVSHLFQAALHPIREAHEHTELLEMLDQLHLTVGSGTGGSRSAGSGSADGFEELEYTVAVMLDITLAAGKGLVRDVLIDGDGELEYINHLDFREWLILHGAKPENLVHGPIKGLYDLGFAYTGGDSRDPSHAKTAAGVALRVCLLMAFDSRGAILWRMNAGMGDTVFAPFYDVLKARGVSFEFFHRVQSFDVSGDGDSKLVDSIDITRTVAINDDAEYDPKLFDLKGYRCWSVEPDWTQIVNGDAILLQLEAEHLDIASYWCDLALGGTRTLKLGVDFDEVVCGIPVGELKMIGRNLSAADSGWADMLANLATVPTQSLQLWLSKSIDALGWTNGPTVMVGYGEPFDSWGEMSHLVDVEDWNAWGANAPQSVEYFCGAMPGVPESELPPRSDHSFPYSQFLIAQQNAEAWLPKWIGNMWPDSVNPNTKSGFDWDLLFDATGKLRGEARLASQFVRVNVDPSERYVLSLPGTTRFRLDPSNTGFENMTVAGDWVRTSMNSGCVEAAVEGGLRAAYAILTRDGLTYPAKLTFRPSTPPPRRQR